MLSLKILFLILGCILMVELSNGQYYDDEIDSLRFNYSPGNIDPGNNNLPGTNETEETNDSPSTSALQRANTSPGTVNILPETQGGGSWFPVPPEVKRIPQPPAKTDHLSIMDKNDEQKLAFFGPKPAETFDVPKPPEQVRGVSTRFPFMNIYRFCSRWWWYPPCRCFFNWMMFCYPWNSNPWCWYWYGCWW
nr:PN rich20kDa silk protein [Plectrocnemia conspersa]